MPMETRALQLHGVTVRYGQVVANRDIDLEVRAGSIHAVVGENGAGKSTLMKAIFGLVPLSAGEIRIHGQPLVPPSPMAAMQHGVGMVHQHFMLVDTLTVVENVMLGHEPRAPGWRGWFGVLDRRRAEEEVAALAERYHLLGSLSPLGSLPGGGKTTTRGTTLAELRRLVRDLSVGERQRVELLRVLYQQSLRRDRSSPPRSPSDAAPEGILILDEPTAVLTPPEVEELFAVLRGWVGGGGTLILVTHKLDEVMAIAEAVTVLRRGEVVTRLETATTSASAIARAMVGRDPVGPPPPAAERPGPELLAVEGLHTAVDARRGAVRDGRIAQRAGRRDRGRGRGGGQRTDRPRGSPHRAPANHRRDCAPVRRRGDTALAVGAAAPRPRPRARGPSPPGPPPRCQRGGQPPPRPRGRIRRPARHARSGPPGGRYAPHGDRVDVRPTDITLPARALSGGNQQKIVLGRELIQKRACSSPRSPRAGWISRPLSGSGRRWPSSAPRPRRAPHLLGARGAARAVRPHPRDPARRRGGHARTGRGLARGARAPHDRRHGGRAGDARGVRPEPPQRGLPKRPPTRLKRPTKSDDRRPEAHEDAALDRACSRSHVSMGRDAGEACREREERGQKGGVDPCV